VKGGLMAIGRKPLKNIEQTIKRDLNDLSLSS